MNKKQRKDLESRLVVWAFEATDADGWSTVQILEQVRKDWIAIGMPSSNSLGLIRWSAEVLDVLGLGMEWEAVKKQKVEDANLVLRAFSGSGFDTAYSALGVEIATDVLRGTVMGRAEILESEVSVDTNSMTFVVIVLKLFFSNASSKTIYNE